MAYYDDEWTGEEERDYEEPAEAQGIDQQGALYSLVFAITLAALCLTLRWYELGMPQIVVGW